MAGILRVDQANVDYIYAKTAGGKVYVPGHIIQIQQTVKTDAFSTSTQNWVDITGLSVNITPVSISSKILVVISLTMGVSGSSVILGARLTRNSTAIAIGDANGSEWRATMAMNGNEDANQGNNGNMTYLDSPASTSTLTYQVQTGQLNTTVSATAYVNRDGNAGNSYNKRGISTITVMEIAQ